jgi:hypothetical protein
MSYKPVRMMVPGNKVVDCERNATSVGTSKIISDVLEDCISLPFSVLSILRAFGFLMIYRMSKET